MKGYTNKYMHAQTGKAEPKCSVESKKMPVKKNAKKNYMNAETKAN